MKKIDIFIIVFLILLTLFAFLSYRYYSSEGGKCLSNPLQYAKGLLGKDSYCSCTIFWDKGSQVIATYNLTG